MLGINNPVLVAATAMVLGGIFGYLSEVWGDAMTKKSVVAQAGQRSRV
jgi:hypothetical protein